MKGDSSEKGPICTALSEIFWGHVLPAMPYEACNMPESGADRHTDIEPEYESLIIDFSQFQGERGG